MRGSMAARHAEIDRLVKPSDIDIGIRMAEIVRRRAISIANADRRVTARRSVDEVAEAQSSRPCHQTSIDRSAELTRLKACRFELLAHFHSHRIEND